MSAGGHTPGPWRVALNEDTGSTFYVYDIETAALCMNLSGNVKRFRTRKAAQDEADKRNRASTPTDHEAAVERRRQRGYDPSDDC